MSDLKSHMRNAIRNGEIDLSTCYKNQTSFRIVGVDGEIDRICQSFCLSRPDDFAISIDAWEDRKARSASDRLPRSRCYFTDTRQEEIVAEAHDFAISWEDRKLRSASDVLPQSRFCYPDTSSKQVVTESKQEETVAEAQITTASSSKEPEPQPERVPESGAVGGATITTVATNTTDKRGIKGIRPPLLTPPSIIHTLKSFEPQNCSSSTASAPVLFRVGTGGKDEGKEGLSNGNDVERGVERDEVDGIRLGVTTLLSGSSSFSDSSNELNDEDDDSSSTTTDPMYIISPEAKFKKNIKSWAKGGLLGSGSFGTVYEGFSDDGFFFAVKEVSLLDQGNLAKQSIYQLEQEISLLSQFEHENIVQYLGTDKDKEKLYIFLELVTKGSLAQLYQKYHLQDSQVSAYTRQILHGLNYLHDRKVVHRDVKCANILVDANGSVKLADFGLAKATKFNDVKSCKGTAFWMAPEVVRSRGYGLAADIWSLGCTVLEMLTRELPYSPMECVQAMYRIGKGELPVVPNSLSRVARDFIHQCLQVKPNDRPTAAQLLEHPFVKRPLSASSGSASPSHPNWRRL